MLEMFSEFVRGYANIDGESLTILLVMVGWSTVLVHIGVESRMFTMMFVPGMVLGGFGAFYLARLGYISFFAAKDVNAIAISVVGILAGFLFTVFILQVIHWVREMRRPLTLEDRR